MVVSVNSVASFNATVSFQHFGRPITRLKLPAITCPSGALGIRGGLKSRKISRFYFSIANGDQPATQTSETDTNTIKGYSSNNGTPDTPTSLNSATNDEVQPSDETGMTAQVLEGSLGSTKPNQDNPSPEVNSSLKRAPLTARERLRAARVLGRYTEPKPSKPELGSKLLEALQETDKGKKRPGLPEAPTNLFDDSKRGLPKEGWSINIIPGGMDVFLIIFSFVFISTVMFATTYIVWKVGAIHFNEY